jgi:hypothetical protein
MAATTDPKPIEMRATVILRIPDLDTQEVTNLHLEIQKIIDLYGGEFDITLSPQLPNQKG